MSRITAFYFKLTVGDRSGYGECPCLDAVRYDRVLRAAQMFDTFDLDDRCPGALNTCSHLVEQLGKVLDLRLHRRVSHYRLSLGERGRHHHVFGPRDGHLFKFHFSTDEAALCGSSYDISGLKRYGCTQFLKRFQM